MSYDEQKVDDTVLALLQLTSFSEGGGTRAWRGQDGEVLNRLHDKGFISDPRNKYKSVLFTKSRAEKSEKLFIELFRKTE